MHCWTWYDVCSMWYVRIFTAETNDDHNHTRHHTVRRAEVITCDAKIEDDVQTDVMLLMIWNTG